MLRALMSARDDVPEALQQFDRIARGGAAWPSFEEYSARVGDRLSPWRETCYFDVGRDPQLIDVANDRFHHLATMLAFPVPPRFFEAIHDGAVSGPDVLQIVLGIDASEQRPRLKYYLIFQSPSHATVERLRSALDVPALPAALSPGSVYILGIDFGREQPVTDFKVYVRLDSRSGPEGRPQPRAIRRAVARQSVSRVPAVRADRGPTGVLSRFVGEHARGLARGLGKARRACLHVSRTDRRDERATAARRQIDPAPVDRVVSVRPRAAVRESIELVFSLFRLASTHEPFILMRCDDFI